MSSKSLIDLAPKPKRSFHKMSLLGVFCLTCIILFGFRASATTETSKISPCALLISEASFKDTSELLDQNIFDKKISYRRELHDQDLALIPLNKNHYKNLIQLYSQADVKKYYLDSRNPHFSAKHTISRANNPISSERENIDIIWAIEESGRFVGVFNLSAIGPLWFPEELQTKFQRKDNELFLAVGYALLPEFRARGLANRSLELALLFAKHVLNPKYVFASTNTKNENSIRALLKSGFLPLSSSSTESIKFYRNISN